MTTKKHIYIIYTGGTIGMKPSKQGFKPAQNYFSKQIAKLPDLQHPQMPNYTLHEYNPLIDSSNASVEHWLQIAQDILTNLDNYDGFVVLHGTDTMAYTSSALSFLLPALNKPIIVTGAQIPINQPRSDANRNLSDALLLASHHPLPEVCLYFNQYLLRGNRSHKVYSNRLSAFRSPNFPPLAEIGINIRIRNQLVLPPNTATQEQFDQLIATQSKSPAKIVALRLFPGFSTIILQQVLQQNIDGLILETYGSGNAPTQDSTLNKVLKQACDRGVVIINCTQCLQGHVQMAQYSTGHRLLEAGVISGYDMTPEAALTKLICLFYQHEKDIETIKAKMQQSLRGELSEGLSEAGLL